MNVIKKLSQVWNYFKKGRGEIGLILSIYNMILTYSIKFNVDFTIMQYVGFSIMFFVMCILIGIFLAENVEPENNRISPYSQDNLNSAIYLQESLKSYYKGDCNKAIDLISEAQKLRKKWLK